MLYSLTTQKSVDGISPFAQLLRRNRSVAPPLGWQYMSFLTFKDKVNHLRIEYFKPFRIVVRYVRISEG